MFHLDAVHDCHPTLLVNLVNILCYGAGDRTGVRTICTVLMDVGACINDYVMAGVKIAGKGFVTES